MRIAIDAARGLAYLDHNHVIHRDLKASNILLENNFHAQVADFGLDKLAPEGWENYLSTCVMGAFGYVTPECAMTSHLLVKGDVYRYRVVLLELQTRRKPVDMLQPSGQENLVTWARPILRDKDRLEELADPKLEGTTQGKTLWGFVQLQQLVLPQCQASTRQCERWYSRLKWCSASWNIIRFYINILEH